MRIDFERTGGFMGRRIAGSLDTKALPMEEAMDILDMIDDASFFTLPEAVTEETGAADQFQYRLTVDYAGRQHTVETTDTGAPDSLRPLLSRLTTLTKTQRK
jgi:hypothetical protein